MDFWDGMVFWHNLMEAYANLNNMPPFSTQWLKLQRALFDYGKLGDPNNVVIKMEELEENHGHMSLESNNTIIVTLSLVKVFGAPSVIAHEGSHVADALDFIASGLTISPTKYEEEHKAYMTQMACVEGSFLRYANNHSMGEAQNMYTGSYFRIYIPTGQGTFPWNLVTWEYNWTEQQISQAIDFFLFVPVEYGGYGLTPWNDAGKAPFFYVTH